MHVRDFTGPILLYPTSSLQRLQAITTKASETGYERYSKGLGGDEVVREGGGKG